MKRKVLGALWALGLMAAGTVFLPVSAEAAEGIGMAVQAEEEGEVAAGDAITGLEIRTEEEVARKYEELMPDLNGSVVYESEPAISAPYAAGQLSEESLQAGLNAVNLVRYIAGLPDDITLNEEYTSYAQHGSVVMGANGELNHYPSCPAGMEEAFFELGYQGTSSSNIGAGYRNLADSVICGYMDDSDDSNLQVLGHRRWMLNPAMTQTGFGYAPGNTYSSFTAMYVLDRARDYSVDYIAWPGAATPTEIYQYTPAFSVFLNESYEVDADQITVTIHSQAESQDYVFGKNAGGSPAGSFYVDDDSDGSYVGMRGSALIFLPENHRFMEDDRLTVSIEGLIREGEESSLSYTVKLFSADEMLAELNKQVTDISVSGLEKTEYVKGEAFSLEGGTLTVNYDNQTRDVLPLTEEMLTSLPDMNTIGSQTVQVSYQEKTASFEIIVRMKPADIGDLLDQEQTEEIVRLLELQERDAEIFPENGERYGEEGIWIEYVPGDVPITVTVTGNEQITYHGIGCGSRIQEVEKVLKEQGWEPPRSQGTFYLKRTNDRWYGFTIEIEAEKVTGWTWMNWVEGDLGETPFTDVPQGAWFYDPVVYVYKNWIMTGLEETVFGPAEALSRAQFAVILYRMEGEPSVEGVTAKEFPDVPDGIWYSDAVAWANSCGIITGYTEGAQKDYFGASDQITRAQMATMMYRYADYKGCDVSAAGDLGDFPDSHQVPDFALQSIPWAVGKEIIKGDGGKLNPQKPASRAEGATIIKRFMEKADQ